MMWAQLFGQFWGLVALTVIVVTLAYVTLILYKHRQRDRAKAAAREAFGAGDRGEPRPVPPARWNRHLHRLGLLLNKDRF
jgi:hypothetical protein